MRDKRYGYMPPMLPNATHQLNKLAVKLAGEEKCVHLVITKTPVAKVQVLLQNHHQVKGSILSDAPWHLVTHRHAQSTSYGAKIESMIAGKNRSKSAVNMELRSRKPDISSLRPRRHQDQTEFFPVDVVA